MQEENKNMNNSSNAIKALSGIDDEMVTTTNFCKPSLMLETFTEKDRLDYLEKRARNNRAVRKSRSKRKDKYDTVRIYIFLRIHNFKLFLAHKRSHENTCLQHLDTQAAGRNLQNWIGYNTG